MARYHLRKDGLPGECRAAPGNCPLGSDADHYSDKLTALTAAEEKLRQETDYLASAKKTQVFHVGENGVAEECKFRDGYCEVKPYGHMNNVHSSDESVAKGAAVGFRAAQVEWSSTPQKPLDAGASSDISPETRAEEKFRSKAADARSQDGSEDPLTSLARDTLQGKMDPFDQRKLNEGWTRSEVKAFHDSCGHTMPARFRPRPRMGC